MLLRRSAWGEKFEYFLGIWLFFSFVCSVQAAEIEHVVLQPYYNKEIRNSGMPLKDGLPENDYERITRLQESHDLDWYLEYCGDPVEENLDLSEDQKTLCANKLENLSEEEAKSLVIYKTNFSKPSKLDPRINSKVLEMISDVREYKDQGKYGYLEDFIYSKDVLLGIIFMEQTNESLAEYKWAYAEVKYLYKRDEYNSLKDKLNKRERALGIIESNYEKDRIRKLKEKYDVDWITKECGKDETYLFEACNSERGGPVFKNECNKQIFSKICVTENDYIDDYFCTCGLTNNISESLYKAKDSMIRMVNYFGDSDFRLLKYKFFLESGDLNEIFISTDYLQSLIVSYELSYFSREAETILFFNKLY